MTVNSLAVPLDSFHNKRLDASVNDCFSKRDRPQRRRTKKDDDELIDLHRQLKSCYRSMGGCWPLNPAPDLFVQAASLQMPQKLPKRIAGAAPARRPKSSLTFDLRPTQRAAKWQPNTLWDHRHHVAVSKQNSFLHMTHKEFFDIPQAYDYKTKPRTPLEPSMIERTGRLICAPTGERDSRVRPRRY